MKIKESSVKSLCEFFWYIEDKYDLFNQKINGVYIWQYVRMPLYYKLATQSGVLRQPHTTERKSRAKRFFNRLLFSVHSIRSILCLFRMKNNYDVVVLEHDRSTLIDGQYCDIYTHHLRNSDLADSNVLSLRLPFGTDYNKTDDSNDYLDLSWLLLLGGVISNLFPSSFNESQEKLISNIQQEIKDRLCVEFDIGTYFSKYITRYRLRYAFLKRIFRYTNANRLLAVTPYSGRGDFIGAAKSVGMSVIEIQHGIISKYHLGYSFPKEINLNYDHILPDSIAIWGWEWNLGANFHSGCVIDNHLVNYPYRHKLNKLSDCEERSSNITVVSQGAISDDISKFVLDNIDRLQEFNIMYKLHPSEYERDNFYLDKLIKFENVSVKKNVDIVDLFFESDIVIGVFSTALIEARLCGCKVIVLPFSGSEYFENEKGYYTFEEIIG